MKKTILFICFNILVINLFSQSPQFFNYQAVIRNSTGALITNQDVSFRISIITGSATGNTVFQEIHDNQSNDNGMCNLKIGNGTSQTTSFDLIDWGAGSYYLKIEIDENAGTTYTNMGTVQLLSVPYSLYSSKAGNSTYSVYSDTASYSSNAGISIYSVYSDTAAFASKVDSTIIADTALVAKDFVNNTLYFSDTDTLFAVKDREGNIVFAVFPDGAEIYVNETAKGKVGGFAVSGRSPSKSVKENYFVVTADSTRVFVNEAAKGKVGGFAVSGRSPSKTIEEDYLLVTADSTRVYVNQSETKGKVGGFAVSGRSPSKETTSNFMVLTPENYFIGHGSGSNNTTGLYNSFLGFEAGLSNTEGNKNVFVGNISGKYNTTGYLNTFIGDETGTFNTTGYKNVFVGTYSGFNNTEGFANVFLGTTAGPYNTTGNRNIFIGQASGYYNEIANYNIFIGNQSGVSNTEGEFNVFLGTNSGRQNVSGEYNVYVGEQTGYANIVGSENTYIGHNAGNEGEDGSFNTFLGSHAGFKNAGSENTFVGHSAGFEGLNGENNTFVGSFAGLNNSGSYNNFIGNYAGFLNTGGSGNVFLGPYAGYKTLGNNNIFIGFGAGSEDVTASNKLYIDNTDTSEPLIYGEFDNDILRINGKVGINTYPFYQFEIANTSGPAYARVKGIADDFSYARVVLMSDEETDKRWDISHNLSNNFEFIYNDGTTWFDKLLEINNNGDLTTGGSIFPLNDDAFNLGSPTKRWNYIYATNDVIQLSDIRFKDNVQEINYGLEQILMLRPVSYNWKDKKDEGLKLGLIAQEVQLIISEIVNVGDDVNKTLGIEYSSLVPVLIKGMQDQQAQIEDLKKMVLDLKTVIEELKSK
ncbi:MAG: hypothetical protein GQ564_22910 [Bacteroidales bacterium]|nr:hypothetical protein [Bacteroidales bacterium]